jgi:DNA helicase IV
MLTLTSHQATAEQLPIISGTRVGVEVIRGAAGSGKTSTALFRLETLLHTLMARQRRTGSTEPIKAVVLTFNRTLAGYVEHVANAQVQPFDNVQLEVETFARWAKNALGDPQLVSDAARREILIALCASIPLPDDF